MNPPAPGTGLPRLHEVTITTARPEVAVRTFEALFGHAATRDGTGTTFVAGQSLVRVVRSETPRGVDGVTLAVQSSALEHGQVHGHFRRLLVWVHPQ